MRLRDVGVGARDEYDPGEEVLVVILPDPAHPEMALDGWRSRYPGHRERVSQDGHRVTDSSFTSQNDPHECARTIFFGGWQ